MVQKDPVKDLILRMVRAVVDTPSAVEVDVIADNGTVRYRISVASEEFGQVIGRQGRTARSLRTILAAISMKEKRRMELDIAGGRSSSPIVAVDPASKL